MMETFIILFFTIWFFLNLIYVIHRKSLGSIGKWLHRFGWMNEWSMFTNQNISHENYRVLYTDINSIGETSQWNEIRMNQFNSSGMIIDSNFKLKHFVNKCIKKMHASKRVNVELPVDQAIFDYLCAIIVQFPNNNKANFRRIKIEKRTENDQWVESICSKAIQLK